MAEEQNEKSFTVNDRRFSARQASTPESQTVEAPSPPSATTQSTRDQAPTDPRTAASVEGVDFGSLLVLLGTQASLYLGDIPNPVNQKREKDIPAAKHFIDLLSLLQVKTKGNLTGEEERLLQQLLFDLRLRYVREAGR
jgi:hypothetical protein